MYLYNYGNMILIFILTYTYIYIYIYTYIPFSILGSQLRTWTGRLDSWFRSGENARFFLMEIPTCSRGSWYTCLCVFFWWGHFVGLSSYSLVDGRKTSHISHGWKYFKDAWTLLNKHHVERRWHHIQLYWLNWHIEEKTSAWHLRGSRCQS